MSDTAQQGAPCDYTNNADIFLNYAAGTSFSAASLAGIQALVNQSSGQSWGNMNTKFYALAASEYGDAAELAACNSTSGTDPGNHCVFHDIVQGDISVVCAVGSPNCFGGSAKPYGALSTSMASFSPAFSAGTGWDYATGLGSVNVDNLVAAATPARTYRIGFTVQPNAGYNAGATISVKVGVENFVGQVMTTDTSAITIALDGGTPGATLGGTLTRNAVNGVATFNDLTISQLGTDYTLKATDGTLYRAISHSFTVAGPPAAISFATAPSNATAGTTITPAIVVHVQDTNGFPIAGDAITLAIANSAGGATLSGTAVVQTDVSGNASFADISLDKVGIGYTLQAKDSSATPLTVASSPFDITVGAAGMMVFTVYPANVLRGNSLGSVTVKETDLDGNLVNDNGTVIFRVPACGSYVSVGSATMTGGIATLAASNARFYSVASNVQLTASKPSLQAAAAFSVIANSDYVFGDAFESCRF